MPGSLDAGVVGLGVMGRALALNMTDRGIRVGGYDLWPAATAALEAASAGQAAGFTDLAALTARLARPRRLMLMVPAGPPVDAVLASLLPHLEPGDVVIDGGNSYYGDTERRIAACAEHGVHLVGAGVSGGEEGARFGPSIMPGGPEPAWEIIAPILRPIAAVAEDGEPCCDWLGTGGIGHAVKTVHNGIEYAFMQLICEAYALLSRVGGLDADACAAVFDRWNTGDLRSFLIEITAKILRVRDEHGGGEGGDGDGGRGGGGGGPLVDVVLDEAEQKGTGRWTAEMALALGVPCPVLAEAVFARSASARRDLRSRLAGARSRAPGGAPPPPDLESDLRDALAAGVVLAFAQGLDLILSTGRAHDWGVRLDRVARLWRAGCIIRIAFLDRLAQAVAGDGAEHVLLDEHFRGLVENAEGGLRRAVALAAQSGVACPALASSLAYLDTIRDDRLPHNLLQAQRDAFGAHRYHRTDRGGVFHTEWLGDGSTRRMA